MKLTFYLFADLKDFEDDKNQQEKIWKYFCEQNNIEFNFFATDTPEYDEKYFDVLLFDWGGMSIGNSLLEHFSRDIIKLAEDNPNRLFVVISDMTWYAFEDAKGEGLKDIQNIVYGEEKAQEYIKKYWIK